MNSPTATSAAPSTSYPNSNPSPAAPMLGTAAAAPEKYFSPLVRQFLDYLKLEKHFSDYTVKSYGADLIQFGQFLAGEIGQLPGAKDGRTVDEKQLKCEPLTIREF